MLHKPSPVAERGRIRTGRFASTEADGCNGAFEIMYRGATLRVIASNGMGWDHVSVSTPTRCPTWGEMCYVKDQFWGPGETVIQFHPPKSEHINNHPYCLHLWRKHGEAIELPPGICVGIKTPRGPESISICGGPG